MVGLQPDESFIPVVVEEFGAEAVAESESRFDWINTDDPNDGISRSGKEIKNDLHMSTEGYVGMGQRFAEKAIVLIKLHENIVSLLFRVNQLSHAV